MGETSIEQWAVSEFGRAELGDIRRGRRLVRMAAGAAKRPSGKVSAVFERACDREGAYDFLESAHVSTSAVAQSIFKATVERAQKQSGADVYVPVDGSSLALTDERAEKGFGGIGATDVGARGLKVISALAVGIDGVPLGVVGQHFWAREPKKRATSWEITKRPFAEKETFFFAQVAKEAIERLAAVNRRAWVIIDREGDSRDILRSLSDSECTFTVRARGDRKIALRDEMATIREALSEQKCLGTQHVEVPRNGSRAARVAKVEVRAAKIQLRLRACGDDASSTQPLHVQVVWARESKARKGIEPLDWLLLTNHDVQTLSDALAVLDSYRARWRIEEFHRTWKTGSCNVEDAQLRSFEAVVKWATVLAAVAARIERLKYFARNKAKLPAEAELQPIEIEALLFDRRRRGERRTRAPSIELATHWIAELGGWMGPSNGPPGSITLARGLERLAHYVDALIFVRSTKRST